MQTSVPVKTVQGPLPMAGSIYEKALKQIASDYPTLCEDPRLWQWLQQVAGHVEQEHKPSRRTRGAKTDTGVGSSTPARLECLQSIFHLQDYELEVLLVCLLPQLSTAFDTIYSRMQPDSCATVCNIELAKRILKHSKKQPVPINTASRLFKHRLLEWLQADNEQKATDTTPVKVSDCIVEFLLGRYEPDPRLDDILEEIESPRNFDELFVEPALKDSLYELAEHVLACRPAVFFFQGAYGTPRQIAAEAMADHGERRIFRINVAAGLRSDLPWNQLVELCFLAAASAHAVLYWRNLELLLGDAHQDKFQQLILLVEKHHGVTFLESTVEWEPFGQFYQTAFLRVEFPMPSYRLQVKLWERNLHSAKCLNISVTIAELAEELASSFQLTVGAILDAINAATRRAMVRDPHHPLVGREDLLEGCRRQAGRRLQDLAQHVAPHLRDPKSPPFAELVLPEASKKRLRDLSQRIQRRSALADYFSFEGRNGFSPGVVALFTGPSGTGKTMAVELLAGEQRRDLYKIDMASIVSKFVGETEQNLSKVFREAEGSNSILFFDECESLFAKRGEVRDPKDRWANMETNYLLQRIEEFEGAVILATNLRQNIDDAFYRRIHVAVEFPFPDGTARKQILNNLLPAADKVDRPSPAEIDAFAQRFQISGGVIRNVIIDAAFRALEDERTATRNLAVRQQGYKAPTKLRITLRHLVIALGREYEKLGRPINQAEFGPQFFNWYDDYLNQPSPQPLTPIMQA